LRLVFTATISVALCAVALVAAPAQAFTGHLLLNSFDGSAVGRTFVHPTGIAIDESVTARAGNVFVAEYQPVIDVFGPEGGTPAGFASPFGIEHSFAFSTENIGVAIDNSGGPSSGDLYVADFLHGRVVKFALDPLSEEYEYVCEINGFGGGCSPGGGNPTQAFADASGIAVDSHGNIYVSDRSHEVIDEFDESGGDVQQIKGGASPGPLGNPGALAFDSAGNLFVQEYFSGPVRELEANGSHEIEPEEPPNVFDSEESYGVAVNQSTDTVYVAHQNHISQYSSTGTSEGEFGNGILSAVRGIAVNAETGDIFVSDTPEVANGRFVRVFSERVTLPDVTTGTAFPVGPNTATLHGAVNPAGVQVAGCEFEWGTTTAYGHNSPCVRDENGETDLGAGTEPIAVHADLEGLEAGTPYHVRLVANNAESAFKGKGEDIAFHTAGSPIVGSQSATGVGQLAATLQAQVNPDAFATTYHFEYIAEGADFKEHGFEHAIKAPPSADPSLGSGQGDQPASQPIEGLAPATLYHYRVVADNSYADTHGGPVAGAPQTFTTLPAVAIDSESVSAVGSFGAVLAAQINPLGRETTYHFEYVDDAHFQGEGGFASAATERVPLSDAGIGSGSSDEAVSNEISGLQAATLYHFRVVADNALAEAFGGPITGPDRTFTTLNSNGFVHLPDSRGWEMVSPTDKSEGRGGVFSLNSGPQYELPLQSSPTGETITYSGEPFSLDSQRGDTNQYFSQRRANGWSTQDITTAGGGNHYVGFSRDLSTGMLAAIGGKNAVPLNAQAPTGYANLYLSNGGSYTPVITTQPPNRTFEVFGHAYLVAGVVTEMRLRKDLLFAGASSDSSHIFFEANDALTPEAMVGDSLENNLYEWSHGQLHAVNLLPGQTHSNPGASFGIDYGDYTSTNRPPNLLNAISADGSRAFWTGSDGSLYVRENPDQPQSALDGGGRCTEQSRACSVRVDAAVGGGGAFQTASTDGALVLFSKGGHLYSYDLETENTVDLAPGGGVQSVMGASDDGSRVYFVSNADLTGGEENEGGEVAQKGQPNVYLGSGGATTFIATLSPQDNELHPPEVEGGEPQVSDKFGDWQRSFFLRTARVSPNGRYLAFESLRPLTGYDNTRTVTEDLTYQVFLYDAASPHALVCASCKPDGSQPSGDPILPTPANAIYQQRYLDDAGQLFFTSPDALAPQDTNGHMDVYEYENGSASLISSGTSDQGSYFADATPSGSDVFFTTHQALLPQDTDEITDLYDARVNGGFPYRPPATPCLGEATCRSPVEEFPAEQTASTPNFHGPEDPHKEPLVRCKSGFFHKHGKCVKHPHTRGHHKRANHNSHRGVR
jgi:hypothetical protein